MYELERRSQRGDKRVEQLGDERGRAVPRGPIRCTRGAADDCERRDHVGRLTGVDRTEDDAELGLAVAYKARNLGRDPTGDRDEIGGEFGASGVAARSVEPNLDEVRGRGDRADAHTDLTGVELGIAMQTEDRVHTVETAGFDHVERAAGHGLLGGLEQQPHPASRIVRREEACERETGTEHDRRMDVVAARVRNPLVLRAIVHLLLVDHRERVEIGAQRDRRAAARADVTHETRSRGEYQWVEPSDFESLRNERSGLELLAAALGPGVELPAEGDQFLEVRVEEGGERFGRRRAHAVAPGVSVASSSINACTTSTSSPPPPMMRRWRR